MTPRILDGINELSSTFLGDNGNAVMYFLKKCTKVLTDKMWSVWDLF